MDREVIFEFIQFGNFVKVTAFDVETKTEVSTIAPSNITQEAQQQAALNKLHYVLEKQG
jgi:hypothetical protein